MRQLWWLSEQQGGISCAMIRMIAQCTMVSRMSARSGSPPPLESCLASCSVHYRHVRTCSKHDFWHFSRVTSLIWASVQHDETRLSSFSIRAVGDGLSRFPASGEKEEPE